MRHRQQILQHLDRPRLLDRQTDSTEGARGFGSVQTRGTREAGEGRTAEQRPARCRQRSLDTGRCALRVTRSERPQRRGRFSSTEGPTWDTVCDPTARGAGAAEGKQQDTLVVIKKPTSSEQLGRALPFKGFPGPCPRAGSRPGARGGSGDKPGSCSPAAVTPTLPPP